MKPQPRLVALDRLADSGPAGGGEGRSSRPRRTGDGGSVVPSSSRAFVKRSSRTAEDGSRRQHARSPTCSRRRSRSCRKAAPPAPRAACFHGVGFESPQLTVPCWSWIETTRPSQKAVAGAPSRRAPPALRSRSSLPPVTKPRTRSGSRRRCGLTSPHSLSRSGARRARSNSSAAARSRTSRAPGVLPRREDGVVVALRFEGLDLPLIEMSSAANARCSP